MDKCELEETIFLQVAHLRREIPSWGLILHNVPDNKMTLKSCPKIKKPPNLYAILLKYLQDPIHWFQVQPPSASAHQLKTHPHDNPGAAEESTTPNLLRSHAEALLQSRNAPTHKSMFSLTAMGPIHVCVTLD